MTDVALLTILQQKLLEPASDGVTWGSGLWTLAEVVQAIDQRQQHFLRESGLLGGWSEQALLPLQEQQPVPTDGVQRVWHGVAERPDGTCSPVNESDRATIDRLLTRWRSTPDWPVAFVWEDLASSTLTIAPAPLTGGRLHLFGPVLALTVATTALSTPEELTLVEDWIPYLAYGALAVLLSKHGRGYDAPRAAYCETRYQEGLQAAQALARDWSLP